MAATRGTVTGHHKGGGSTGTASRLGGHSVSTQAATWHTFARTTVHADGSGEVTVTQNGEVIHRFVWGGETVAHIDGKAIV